MNRRKFINLIGCSCLSFGLSACGSAPITDRKQLKLIPESSLNAKAAQLYEKVKEKETLSDDTKTLNQIKEIGSKIEYSISEYLDRNNIPDPTVNFDCKINLSNISNHSSILFELYISLFISDKCPNSKKS